LSQTVWQSLVICYSVKFSDVHIHCLDGTILHAHRNILSAASPYFATVFEGPWGDEHPNGVWNTANPVDLMKVILTHIYIGVKSNDEMSNQPLAILSLAHEYQLTMLVKATERVLMEQIEVGNVKELLQSSVLYNLVRLKQSCSEFIKNNSRKVLMNEDFMKLATEDKALWIELRSFLL